MFFLRIHDYSCLVTNFRGFGKYVHGCFSAIFPTRKLKELLFKKYGSVKVFSVAVEFDSTGIAGGQHSLLEGPDILAAERK